ncbi:glycoside hydrolase family 3 protein [Desulfobotulus sp.]|uniref:glycoside hydrolase family 3 protein n=1 Tax=Desulfobotulus sp. TaxID=1940337 RepID=UPI002A363B36|nr:glycoside hydrolase family 3 N-terminal domain-containing protein [Desulfobotulus sp.]MDY0164442.1 glycoside hydrolase family 3 N-terminal domain-containing protein [Desulfobotulus sp.]
MKFRPLLLLFLLFVLFFLLPGCSGSTENPGEEVSLEEQIGQMLLIGFRGTEITQEDAIFQDIRDRHIGGVILYEYDAPSKTRPRNIVSEEQVKALTRTLRSASPTPLFIAIDQEGGFVNRLKERYGFPATVSAQHLGDLNDGAETRKWAAQTADTLQNLGINVNFAPVVDVNVNPDCPVIGKIERSFSASPELVFRHSSIFVEEQAKRGVLSALKHFPGHGSSREDSHYGFTDTSDTWRTLELYPYLLHFMNDFKGMVMTAHTFNRNLDPDDPATLSHSTLTGILRRRLGWEGIIVSDDMQMGAITEHYGMEVAIEKAILAGVDILIFSNNSPAPYNEAIAGEAMDIIKKLVAENRISKERIALSYERIRALKKKLTTEGTSG